MNVRVCRSLLGILGAAVGIAAAAPTLAASAQTDNSTGMIKEIVVTAQRIKQSEQRTPVSVVTYSSAKIAREGIHNLQTLAAVDPSLQFNRNGGRADLTIRGVSTSNTTEIGNPSVPVVIDEFTVNQPIALDSSLFDVGQITVLRGPQGTLFGRSATGGIVQISTNHPTRRFEVSASQEFGNYNSTDSEGVLNVPVKDDLQLRVAIFSRRHSGYRIDTTPLVGGVPSNADDLDAKGGRVELAWEPTKRLKALLIYQMVNINDAGPAIQAIPFNYIDPTNVNSDIYHTMPDRGNGSAFPIIGSQWYRSRDQVGKLHVTYALPGGMHLTYYGGLDVLNHNELDSGDPQWPPAFDAVNGPYTINEFNYAPRPVTQNHELRLTSSAAGSFVWQAGLYYFLETNHLFAQNVANPDSVIASNNLLFQYHVRTESKAAYGQASYQVNSENQVSLGLRYSADKLREFGTFQPGTAGPFFSDHYTSSNRTTWHLGYRFTPTPVNMLYGKVDTGYKPGGFSSCGGQQQNYNPESVINYELGSKNRLLNNHLQANATVFYEDYSNQQVSQWSRGCSTGMITTNAGKSRIYGLEAQMIAAINRANRVNLNISYLRARYLQFATPPELGSPALQDCPASTVYGPGGALIGQQCNLAGYTMPQAPTLVATMGYEHHWRLSGEAGLTFRINGRYSTKEYLTPFNFPDETQTGYFTGDLYLDYNLANWQVALFARNFTNTTYIDYAAENSGGSDYLYAYGDPRTYGIRVSVELNKHSM